MNAKEVVEKIKANRDSIKKYGVKRLGLFGSYSRGDANPKSDLDFVVEFEHKSFDAYMGLKQYLEELFNITVDLVLIDSIKPRLRSQILKEIVDAA